MKIHLTIVFLLTFAANYVFAQGTNSAKINGLSLVSERFILDSSHVDPILEVNANYVAVIPFCFMPAVDSSAVIFGGSDFWKGEGLKGTRKAIQELHKKNVKTMIKPQVWVSDGVFTGEVKMKSEESWGLFEQNYSAYILAFAKVAEEEDVEILCIGTEMGRVVEFWPELFPRLIEKVRKIYSGKITYAENWDRFDKVEFWGELDYIGVDAYFPISNKRNPSVKKMEGGWAKYLPQFDSISAKFDRKILFTEFGYRSIKKCTATPWAYKAGPLKVNQGCQSRALKALFNSVWDQEYFAGGFMWKWHLDHENAGGKNNSMFTVQNKEAEEVVKLYYGKYGILNVDML